MLITKILRNITVFCELIPRTDTEDIRNPLLSSLRKGTKRRPHCLYNGGVRHWGTRIASEHMTKVRISGTASDLCTAHVPWLRLLQSSTTAGSSMGFMKAAQ